MLDHRKLFQEMINGIEDMFIVDLNKYDRLQRLLPELYQAIQIEDECDHKFKNGQCICGKIQDEA